MIERGLEGTFKITDEGENGKSAPHRTGNEINARRKSSLHEKIIQNVILVPSTIAEKEGHRMVNTPVEMEKISNAEAVLQLTKITLGTGILMMPQAFMCVGLWQGFFLIICISVLTLTTYRCLIAASQYLAERNKVSGYTFGQTARLALEVFPATQPFAKHAENIISTLIVVSCFSVAIIYVLLIAKNITEMTAPVAHVPLRAAIAVQLPFLMVTNWISSMKRITPVTAMGMMALWTGYGLTAYSISKVLIDNGPSTVVEDWKGLENTPLFLSIAVFAYVGIAAVNAIENNMNTPKALTGCPSVSCVAVVLVSTLYIAAGVLGYLAFGSDTKGPITSNFDKGNTVGVVLKGFITIGLLFSFPILLYAPLAIVENRFSRMLDGNRMARIVCRIIIITILVAIPLILKDIEAGLQIFTIPLALLQFVIPLIIDSLLFWSVRTKRQNIIMTARNVVIASLGLLFVIVGLYFGIAGLINAYKIPSS